MKILSWNINGIRPSFQQIKDQYKSVSDYFESLNADCLCFQEAKIQECDLTEDLALIKGYSSFWSFCKLKKGYSGVVTFIKDSYDVHYATSTFFEDPQYDDEGRVIVTILTSFILVNVYVPNEGMKPDRPRLSYKMSFLKAFYHQLQQYEQRYKLPIVIVGDFNIAQNDDIHPQLFTKEDKKLIYFTEEEQEMLTRFTDTYMDSYDVIRKRKENEKTTEDSMIYSCWNQYKQHRSLNIGERIDYILLSKSLLPSLLESTILNTSSSLSDHAAICCSLSLNVEKNAQAFRPPFYYKQMKPFLSQTKIQSFFQKRNSKDEQTAKSESDDSKKCRINEIQQQPKISDTKLKTPSQSVTKPIKSTVLSHKSTKKQNKQQTTTLFQFGIKSS